MSACFRSKAGVVTSARNDFRKAWVVQLLHVGAKVATREATTKKSWLPGKSKLTVQKILALVTEERRRSLECYESQDL